MEVTVVTSLHCKTVLWRGPCGLASMATELQSQCWASTGELLRHHRPYSGSSNPKWFCEKNFETPKAPEPVMGVKHTMLRAAKSR